MQKFKAYFNISTMDTGAGGGVGATGDVVTFPKQNADVENTRHVGSEGFHNWVRIYFFFHSEVNHNTNY